MYYSKSSHIGSCFSCIEILYSLYFRFLSVFPDNPKNEQRDIFILSKAHASAALYAILAKKGFFSKSYLDFYYTDDGKLPGHLDKGTVPGIEVSAGSLGHGLSIGAGMAFGYKNQKKTNRIVVLVGDGECNEGSIWEAIMFASACALDNLTLIVDHNNLQGFGSNVLKLNNLSERLKSFGWESYDSDGHDIEGLIKILNYPQRLPKAIVAHTIKGKGISFMENKLEWHYKSPNDEQFKQALFELKD